MLTLIRHQLRIAHRVLGPTFWSLTALICLNDKVLEIVSVNGPSMMPTLSPTYHESGNRDYLLMSKWAPTANLRRGDVVSFYTPHKPDTLGIKRVIGIEGDWVEMDIRRRPEDERRGGRVGKAVAWDLMGQMHDQVDDKRRVQVPFGHVWVEGDNWRMSKDSNDYGPISKSLINGKAVGVVWPLSRLAQKPWEGFRGKTRVKEGQGMRPLAWDDL